MRHVLSNLSLATRLGIVLIVLILLTTLSAGVPAFLLTRSQLEQQAWQRVEATARATQSLYDASQGRVTDLTALLAERPTLRRLLQENDLTAVEPYLRAFQEQSDLDLILLCDGPGVIAATIAWPPGETESGLCPIGASSGVEFVAGRPSLLAGRDVLSSEIPESLGMVVTGIFLDEEFLTQLSANTGVQQTILGDDGRVVASTLPGGTATVLARGRVSELSIAGSNYFTSQFALPGHAQGPLLLAEVELPVDQLMGTERSALSVLVLSTGLVTLVGVVLGTWFIRLLTAPLLDLTRAAEQISEGDLAAPIPRLAQPPEMATLSDSLEKSQATMLEALEERSQARDWLNSLIQSVVEGVVTFDTHGQVTFMSQGAETLTGWSSAEMVGRPITALLPLADAPDDTTFLDRLPPAGEKREIEVLSRSGKSLVLATTGARMVPPNSDTVQVALVLRDVTEEQALHHLRSFFLANISHEFRTPLSTLNASIELLMDQADDLSAADIRELLKPTHMSLLTLQSLIDNLLEGSSIEAGSFVLRRRPVNLNEVIGNALVIVRPLVERRRQPVAVTEPAEMPPLLGDGARLTQALVNLLTNASKYSPIGRPIDLRVKRNGSMLRLEVADRGPGISAADRANVFRRFVRLEGATHEQYGIGLGLYVVKRIAEAHEGQVGVSDRRGGGSIFWLDLPFPVEAPVGEAEL